MRCFSGCISSVIRGYVSGKGDGRTSSRLQAPEQVGKPVLTVLFVPALDIVLETMTVPAVAAALAVIWPFLCKKIGRAVDFLPATRSYSDAGGATRTRGFGILNFSEKLFRAVIVALSPLCSVIRTLWNS